MLHATRKVPTKRDAILPQKHGQRSSLANYSRLLLSRSNCQLWKSRCSALFLKFYRSRSHYSRFLAFSCILSDTDTHVGIITMCCCWYQEVIWRHSEFLSWTITDSPIVHLHIHGKNKLLREKRCFLYQWQEAPFLQLLELIELQGFSWLESGTLAMQSFHTVHGMALATTTIWSSALACCELTALATPILYRWASHLSVDLLDNCWWTFLSQKSSLLFCSCLHQECTLNRDVSLQTRLDLLCVWRNCTSCLYRIQIWELLSYPSRSLHQRATPECLYFRGRLYLHTPLLLLNQPLPTFISSTRRSSCTWDSRCASCNENYSPSGT